MSEPEVSPEPDTLNRILNGVEIGIGEWFLWLNVYGFGIGWLDHEGLGRRQFVVYRNGWRLRRG